MTDETEVDLVTAIRAMTDEEFADWKPDGFREKANPDATVPTGMCGSPKKCYYCPSDFLCTMKASDEMKLIKARA